MACPAATAGSASSRPTWRRSCCPSRWRSPTRRTPLLEQLAGGQALFFRGLSDLVGATDDTALAELVWDLVWAGVLTNDTLAPLRVRLGGGGTHRRTPAPPGCGSAPAGTGAVGWAVPRCPPAPGPRRWPAAGPGCPTARPTRPGARPPAPRRCSSGTGCSPAGAVMAEQVAGGFSAVYPVLRAFEENGRARRGYFVETLGAAQFGTPGSVDRLRSFAAPDRQPGRGGGAGRDRSGERLRRGAALARASGRGRRRMRSTSARAPDPDAGRHGPPGRPQGGRAGRPGRRRAGALRRARRQDAAVLDRGRAPAQGGVDGAVRCRQRPGRWAGSSSRRPTARRCTSRPRSRRPCRQPASPRPRGACASAAEGAVRSAQTPGAGAQATAEGCSQRAKRRVSAGITTCAMRDDDHDRGQREPQLERPRRQVRRHELLERRGDGEDRGDRQQGHPPARAGRRPSG